MTYGTKIWWVRHGPTYQKSFCGWRDVDADLGDHDLIARISAALPRNAPVISSDLKRAIHTADALQSARLRLPHDPALREFDFGDWDGKSFDDVAKSDPVLSRQYWETPGDIAPPNGESWNQLALRVGHAVTDLIANRSEQDIVVVAHIGVILTQVAVARDQSPSAAIAQPIRPLSVSQITYNGTTATAGPIDQLF